MTTSFIPPHMMQQLLEERRRYLNAMHMLYGQLDCVDSPCRPNYVLMPIVKETDGSPLTTDDITDATLFVIRRKNASTGTTNERPLWEGNSDDLEEVRDILLTHYGYVYEEDRK
tara:strand:+ start:71 stop:412 length:342 start_codon:yes stop_codon:yes gene_type:complete